MVHIFGTLGAVNDTVYTPLPYVNYIVHGIKMHLLKVHRQCMFLSPRHNQDKFLLRIPPLLSTRYIHIHVYVHDLRSSEQ